MNLVVIYEEGSEYSLTEGDGRNEGWGEYPSQIGPEVRDLGTETHYEYGSRAGIWRIARLADRYQVPLTLSATAVALQRNPAVADWYRSRPADLMGHGYRWSELYTMSRAEEKEQLQKAVSLYKEVLGERPLGWNSRSFPSVYTRELLAEEGGFLYDSDPCNDDLPYFVDVSGQTLLVIPYTKTLNDTRYLIAPGYSRPQDFTEHCCLALDYLAEESAETGSGRLMTVAVHARWTGQPNRAAGLRDFITYALAQPGIRFMRRVDIANWWIAHHRDFSG